MKRDEYSYSSIGLIVKAAILALPEDARRVAHRAMFLRDDAALNRLFPRGEWQHCSPQDKILLLGELNRWREEEKRQEMETIHASLTAAQARREARDPEKEKYKQRYRERVSQKTGNLLRPPEQGGF